jgi:hypothetical protein
MDNVKNLTVENWRQLVIYYKDKSVELEFSSLMSQIDYQKKIKEIKDEYEETIKKQKELLKISTHVLEEEYENKLKHLQNQIIKINKKNEKIKNVKPEK